jgi:hypothetical protein
VAVTLTVVVPITKALPDAGTDVIVIAPAQLSVAVGTKFTTATHEPAGVTAEILAGHVTTGAVTSLTVMICTQFVKLPHTSVARYVLVTVNLLTQLPGVVTSPTWDITTAPTQLSVAVTNAKLTAGTAAAQLTVTAGGQAVIVGAVRSFTVIICVQVAVLPATSVAR